jgi:hypothetical protein
MPVLNFEFTGHHNHHRSMSVENSKKRKRLSAEELKNLQGAADEAADHVCELQNMKTPLPENLRDYRNIRRSVKDLINEDNDEGVNAIMEKCIAELDAKYESLWTSYETIHGEEEGALEKARGEELKLQREYLEASDVSSVEALV